MVKNELKKAETVKIPFKPNIDTQFFERIATSDAQCTPDQFSGAHSTSNSSVASKY